MEQYAQGAQDDPANMAVLRCYFAGYVFFTARGRVRGLDTQRDVRRCDCVGNDNSEFGFEVFTRGWAVSKLSLLAADKDVCGAKQNNLRRCPS
jgi:hypothetical protein